jgi:acyl-CoA thioesterase
MDALAPLVGLGPVGGPAWGFAATPDLCAGDGQVFGGSLLAAGICALEEAVGLPLAVTSAEFLGAVRAGDEVRIVCEGSAPSRTHGLVRASASCAVGDRVVARLAASLVGDDARGGSVAAPGRAPDVPAPVDCPPREYRWPAPESISSWLEVRIARDVSAEGHLSLWTRLAGIEDPTPASLGLVSDHVAFAVRAFLGGDVGVRSLDHSLRIGAGGRGPWVLLDIAVSFADACLAHGRVDLWSEDGVFLAAAEQSVLVTRASD